MKFFGNRPERAVLITTHFAPVTGNDGILPASLSVEILCSNGFRGIGN
jgi:hypothetical protein